MKHMRRFTALVLALVMVFSLTVSASAADTPKSEQVTAYLNYNLTVRFNGEAKLLGNVNGSQVYPITYGGTTYVPVRAISNLLGLDVTWIQEGRIVKLSDSNDTKPITVKPDSPKKSGLETIQPTIDPGIRVIYNGKDQEMKTVKGETVYPMLIGGTTYLPIRAVGDMLGLEVGWEQATQTVTLDFPKHDHDPSKVFHGYSIDSYKFTAWYEDGTRELFGLNEFDDIWETVQGSFTEEYLKTTLELAMKGMANDPFMGKQTSEDAKVLGDKHLGYDWGEIDWSTASKGYVRVKVNTELIGVATCDVQWYNKDSDNYGHLGVQSNLALTDGWQNIPLWHSNEEGECLITINVAGVRDGYYLSWDDNMLQARFTATIKDSDSMWLMSNVKADYDRAPNACAKAKELTKNCKTDAEKITAIYNFVSSTIVYDKNLMTQGSSAEGAMYLRNLNPDNILASKRGVCEHYAVLMTAMLRSVGVPCKFVSGWAYLNGEWIAHAWVAVNPKTGTLNISGAGKDHAGYDLNDKPTDPTGWIRLDPTNAHAPNVTSNDNNYKTNEYY
ncbi:MAG: lasso peptide biosynthesis protein [Oscillospiraceae bacterium]|nr:lasso peptide biosynthesis protein [Oscillospiraceae bacterium]